MIYAHLAGEKKCKKKYILMTKNYNSEIILLLQNDRGKNIASWFVIFR